MTDVTNILATIEHGDPAAAEQLLPLVYSELRKLAAAKLANEKASQTLQATALVHEAYLRLLGPEAEKDWDSRGHFFAAAAEAMRRILVDKAREKRSKAIVHSEKSVATGEIDLFSPCISGAMLQRMRASKNWPAWIQWRHKPKHP